MKCRKVVVDDAIPFLKGVLEPFTETIFMPGELISPAVLKDADALFVRTRTHCNASLLSGTSVRFVGTATIGTDHLDTKYLKQNQIKWSSAPGCNADSVCQYIVSALFEISSQMGKPLDSLTLGIVGVGQIGNRVFRCAKALGMNVLLCDGPRERLEGIKNFSPLSKLIKESDILSFHVPLTSSGEFPTFHIADDDFFQKLNPKMWLINSSRGAVVDNAALLRALFAKKISGAVLDVWENEPQISQKLLPLISIATPHIAGYSLDGKANATSQIVREWAKFFEISELHSYEVKLENSSEILEADFTEEPLQTGLKNLYQKTYSILEDDALLRRSPSDFEKLRRNYRKRREPSAYCVSLKGEAFLEIQRLEKLGFTKFLKAKKD